MSHLVQVSLIYPPPPLIWIFRLTLAYIVSPKCGPTRVQSCSKTLKKKKTHRKQHLKPLFFFLFWCDLNNTAKHYYFHSRLYTKLVSSKVDTQQKKLLLFVGLSCLSSFLWYCYTRDFSITLLESFCRWCWTKTFYFFF